MECQATWYESLDVNLDKNAVIFEGDGGGEYSRKASYEPSDISVKAGLVYQIQ